MVPFKYDGYDDDARKCRYARVPFNPRRRRMFDCTPNEDRPHADRRWFYRPFIVTECWQARERETLARTDHYAASAIARLPEWREAWFSSWPTGVRYEVRCLDGGCWDRATSWAMVGNITSALLIADFTGRERYPLPGA